MTLAIVLATYAAVAVGRVPLLRIGRSGLAAIGALLLVLTGAIGVRDAAAAIDVRTILLLLAMMIVVAPLQITGVFGRLIAWVSRRVHHPAALLAAIRRHEPLPYLLALATASNIGSVATVVGNPQNILIGTVSRMSPWHFSAVLVPIALAGLGLDVIVIWLIFRIQLIEQLADRESIAAAVAPRRVTLTAVARTIDWKLLVLFAGLFVVIGAVERAGIDQRLFVLLQPLGLDTLRGLTATAAVLSNTISNVPAVMLFTRVVPRLPDPHKAWLALAMASTLAGNLTILGSIANLIVVEGANRRGVTVTFGDYVRVGAPVTLVTLAFGMWWLS